MSREGDQVREWPQKDLQPHRSPGPSLNEETLFPACVPLCNCLWLWQIQEPRSSRPRSTGNLTVWKMNLEISDDVPFPLFKILWIQACPRSMRLKKRGWRGQWRALFMSSVWANLSHTSTGDQTSYTHKGMLVLAPVLRSPSWAPTCLAGMCRYPTCILRESQLPVHLVVRVGETIGMGWSFWKEAQWENFQRKSISLTFFSYNPSCSQVSSPFAFLSNF